VKQIYTKNALKKNLTSNAGVLLLLNYTEEQRTFQAIAEMLVFMEASGRVFLQKSIWIKLSNSKKL
jgi:hypothetical protein